MQMTRSLSDLMRVTLRYVGSVLIIPAVLWISSCTDPQLEPDPVAVPPQTIGWSHDTFSCLESVPYQFLIINKTDTYKTIEFQTKKYTGDYRSGCTQFKAEYSYTLRKSDFAYIDDFVYFRPHDSRSSTPVTIIDSLGNRLSATQNGNGTYEITNIDGKPDLVKVSDDFGEFSCAQSSCTKYVRPFDVTVTNSRKDELSVIADVFFYRCHTTEDNAAGACFPHPLADRNAEVFILETGEFRNFRHMADRIIISFEDEVIDLDPRKNPEINGMVQVEIFRNEVDIELGQ